MSDVVVPPSQAVWWDGATTFDNVLHQLRLDPADVDAERINTLIPAAGRLINAELDRVDDLTQGDPELQAALEQVVCELYRRKDAGTGNPDDWSFQMATGRFASADPVAEVRPLIAAHKQRWGVG